MSLFDHFLTLTPRKVTRRRPPWDHPAKTVNFGPAHPAAHGVFRLLLRLSSEIATEITHSQGLLWRATEFLTEYRNTSLNSGYFARMDYVAYVAEEIGFSSEVSAHTSENLGVLLLRNFVANHFLNVACTIGDSGALGAILWGFEARELDLEFAETVSGARLHVNLASSGSVAGDFLGSSLSQTGLGSSWNDLSGIFAISEFLLLSGTGIKANRSRLFANFVVSADLSNSSGCSGYLLNSAGLSDSADDSSGQFAGLQLFTDSADSLARHVARMTASAVWASFLINSTESAAISTHFDTTLRYRHNLRGYLLAQSLLSLLSVPA
jgi:NADH:ubiquinone oxidoreductase subunit D